MPVNSWIEKHKSTLLQHQIEVDVISLIILKDNIVIVICVQTHGSAYTVVCSNKKNVVTSTTS